MKNNINAAINAAETKNFAALNIFEQNNLLTALNNIKFTANGTEKTGITDFGVSNFTEVPTVVFFRSIIFFTAKDTFQLLVSVMNNTPELPNFDDCPDEDFMPTLQKASDRLCAENADNKEFIELFEFACAAFRCNLELNREQ